MIPPGMTLKEARRWMANDAKGYGVQFVELPIVGARRPPGLLRAWRNRNFLAQLYEPEEHQREQILARLSINRAVLNESGSTWLDGITWDQLQAMKNALGYAEHDALEVYPHEAKVVNVAAIRHLWIMRERLPWAWGAKNGD